MTGRSIYYSALAPLIIATLSGCGGDPAPIVTKDSAAVKAEPVPVNGKGAKVAQPRSYGRD